MKHLDPRLPARFWSKCTLDHHRGCWLWIGRMGRGGYARWTMGQQCWAGHKFAFLRLRGSYDETLELDHLCRVRHCVNPAHLEPVTHTENVRRGVSVIAEHMKKATCIRGHEFEVLPATSARAGRRLCRVCMNAKATERSLRRHRARIAAGLCGACGKESLVTKTLGQLCRDHLRRRDIARSEKRAAARAANLLVEVGR